MRLNRYISEAKSPMQVWSEKRRKKELALPAVERLKEIEKGLSSRLHKYKHPHNLEDLRFYKKYKPRSFWKKLEGIVKQEHHPIKTPEIMKFLRKNIK